MMSVSLQTDLAKAYAQFILAYSDYKHTQQDKLFFESVYEATNLMLQEAFMGRRKNQVRSAPAP